LDRCENGTSDDHEACHDAEQYWDKDGRLERPFEVRLLITQDYVSRNGEEEKCIWIGSA
jgi:hypothetical protein